MSSSSSSQDPYSILKGMKDILPKDEKYWRNMYEEAQKLADAYHFGRIETPVLERKELFTSSVGEDSDIVNKEMYAFTDKGGNEVVLKPENTASVARSFVSNGMRVDPKPKKMWYWEQFYRYEQPQSGRYRRFHQVGFESFGVKEPIIEAELINIMHTFFSELGLETEIHINNIGTVENREDYLVELKGYLKSKKSYLSDKSKQKLDSNPFRILDSKQEEDQPIIEEAPQIIDWIDEESKQYMMSVIEYLDKLDIPYQLDPTLVRGLDYYNDTVFEFFEPGQEDQAQSALGAGGRYDKLTKELGDKEEMPAAGFSIGLERVVTAIRRKEQESDFELVSAGQDNNIFFAQLGEDSRKQALNLIDRLRKEDLFVQHNLGKKSLRDQLELADDMNADYALILGQKEAKEDSIIIRDMESGNQRTIEQSELVTEVKELVD